MRQTSLVAGVLAAAAFAFPVAQQQQPTFRSGVDVTTIDVTVLDKSGAPVSGLTADDFLVTVAKKPRRVVSAQFVSSVRPARAAANLLVPVASSNSRTAAPRTVILLVDVDQIPSGGGRVAMRGIGDYLDRLLPDDRVGVMTLIENRVAPTTERAPVREAVNKLVGVSNRMRDKEMTFGEAPGIAARDRSALMALWYRIVDQGFALPGDRACLPPQSFERIMAVPENCVREAEFVLERIRLHTRRVLTRLGAIAEAMAATPEPKAIVLASGGVLTDSQLRNDVNDLALRTERAHVTIHSLLIEADASAAGGNSSETRRLDSSVGFSGLADIAETSRGSVQRVLGDSSSAVGRLDRELSGYYVLSLEQDPLETAGERAELEVKANRPGVSVRARKGVTPARPNKFADRPATELKGSIAELLKSAAPVAQVPLDVDVFALPVSAVGTEARAVIAIEAGRDPTALAAFGFQLADTSGKVIGDGYEAPPPFQQKETGRSLFIVQAPLAVGKFVGRFAVVDSQGQRGSVQHTFEIPPWPAGSVRVSDVILGSGTGESFGPAALVSVSRPLVGRLVVRDSASKFADMRVRAIITRASDDAPIETIDVPLQQTPDALRRFADCELRVDGYPPGEYVVSMVVTSGGTEVARKRRIFVR